MPDFVEIEQFKRNQDLQKQSSLLRKHYALEPIKAVKETSDGLIVDFVISTETVDRDSDTIAVDGWVLDGYRKNPVILFAHNSRQLPVAKSLSEVIEDKKLKSKAQFTPKDLNEFGYMTGQMYAKGFMNAVSVGFRGIEWAFTQDKDRPYGIDWKRQELMEYSTVPVPSNPEALLDAKGAGIDVTPMLNWAVELLENADFKEKSIAERVWKALNTNKTFIMPSKPPGQPESTPPNQIELEKARLALKCKTGGFFVPKINVKERLF
jgi:phage head maturation protease